MKFDWREFFNKKETVVVHCKTKEEAKNFLNKAKAHNRSFTKEDISWLLGRYDAYKSQTCYSNHGGYGGYNFCLGEYKIYEWSDYMSFTEDGISWYNKMEY